MEIVFTHLGEAFLVHVDDLAEQFAALGHRGLGIALKRRACGLNRTVEIIGRAERDLTNRLLGCRVDDIECARGVGWAPLTADEKLVRPIRDFFLRAPCDAPSDFCVGHRGRHSMAPPDAHPSRLIYPDRTTVWDPRHCPGF